MNSVIYVCIVLIIIQTVRYVNNLPQSHPDAHRAKRAAKTDCDKEETEDDKECVSDCLCLTPGCVKAANDVLSAMNDKIDPCDNFYEFACGKFLEETVIPDDKSIMDLFTTTEDKVTEQLRIVLEEPISENEPRAFKLTKEYYETCMDTAAVKELGLKGIRQILHGLGGWPVVTGEKWDESKFSWKDTVYKLREKGFSIDYLIQFSVVLDFKHTLSRKVYLDQPFLFLEREYLVNGMEDKLVQALYSYMVDIAVMFGADEERVKKELKDVIDFKIEISKISTPKEERRNFDRMYNAMTINQLQEKYPLTNWLEYTSTMLGPSVNVKPDDVLIVVEKSYLQELTKVLATVPKRTLANYLVWRAVAYSVPYLTEELRRRQLDYLGVMLGQKEREPRWKECVNAVAGSLDLGAGAMYIRRFFNPESKVTVSEIVKNVREEMYKTLETVDWMDDNTRENAVAKARAMTSHIAYPEELLDDNKLCEFYEKCKLTQGDFLESSLQLNIFGRDFTFSRLKQPVDKTEWVTHGFTAVVNAFYSPIENTIMFPAGILQGRFFSQDRPAYMNYGSIGVIISHEITHGFDDMGQQFNKEGDMVEWWNIKTKEAFLLKTKYIVSQYGRYYVEQVGVNLNGVNTQGENIADNGGAKLAYQAYSSWVSQHGKEKRLPGLEKYTPKQMFWIGFANTWCRKIRTEALRQAVTTNEHSPAEFRIKGSFSNRPEFAKDFKCAENSKMNPTGKYSVW